MDPGRIVEFSEVCVCRWQERKVAVLLYGFPPGVGATGTAALLNVPQVGHWVLSCNCNPSFSNCN